MNTMGNPSNPKTGRHILSLNFIWFMICTVFWVTGCQPGGLTVGKIISPNTKIKATILGVSERSLTLTPHMDAMTLSPEDYKLDNFGQDELLMVGADRDGWTWHTFMTFDLSEIPKNSEIVKATLTLHPREVYNGYDSSIQLGIYAVTTDWSELNLNWPSQPVTENSPTVAIEIQRENTEPDTFEISSLVQEWVNSEKTNYGIMLKSENEYLDVRRGYFSTNSSDTGNFPSLHIIYRLNE